jgi:hypothetical protein
MFCGSGFQPRSRNGHLGDSCASFGFFTEVSRMMHLLGDESPASKPPLLPLFGRGINGALLFMQFSSASASVSVSGSSVFQLELYGSDLLTAKGFMFRPLWRIWFREFYLYRFFIINRGYWR